MCIHVYVSLYAMNAALLNLIRDLFEIILTQKFRKGRPDLCSEMTCQQNSNRYQYGGGVPKAVAAPPLYYDYIPSTSTSTSTTSFPSLHATVDHTRMILPRQVAVPLLLPSSSMTRCFHAGLGNANIVPCSRPGPFVAFPPTLTQYGSNSALEESLRHQHEMENVYDAMLRMSRRHELLQQTIVKNHFMKLALSSYRNKYK